MKLSVEPHQRRRQLEARLGELQALQEETHGMLESVRGSTVGSTSSSHVSSVGRTRRGELLVAVAGQPPAGDSGRPTHTILGGEVHQIPEDWAIGGGDAVGSAARPFQHYLYRNLWSCDQPGQSKHDVIGDQRSPSRKWQLPNETQAGVCMIRAPRSSNEAFATVFRYSNGR